MLHHVDSKVYKCLEIVQCMSSCYFYIIVGMLMFMVYASNVYVLLQNCRHACDVVHVITGVVTPWYAG